MGTKKNQIAVLCLVALCLQSTCAASYEPKRVAGVPQDAVWAGGPDGGSWFLCESNNAVGTHYFCRVFNDFNGSEMASGGYVLRRVEWSREQQKATYSEIKEFRQVLKYNSFDGSNISLKDSLILLPEGKVFSGG